MNELERTRADLARDLQSWMAEGARAGPPDDARFTEMALRVFGYQFAANAPYRRFCERRGVRPDDVREWRDIPAVATDAFKEVPLTCFPPARAAAVFVTSGTTRGAEGRGRHYLRALDLYHAALAPSFEAHVLPDGARLPAVILGFSPRAMPASSLSHMFGVIVERLARAPGSHPALSSHGSHTAEGGASSRPFDAPPARHGERRESDDGQPYGDGITYFLGPRGIDLDGATARLAELEAAGEPVLLMGTAFAFVHMLDFLVERGRRLRLPPGSRLMDTGGYKGRSREVPKDELYRLYTGVLDIPDSHIVNEYGMTEMSSQFYDGVLQDDVSRREGPPGAGDRPERPVGERAARRKAGPPWVRTMVVDAETLAPVAAGVTGVLRHYDLANLDSVIALQTADLGVADASGFEITGRATGAEARGCSLAVEELLRAQ